MSESAEPDYVPFASDAEPEPERYRLTTRETGIGWLIASSSSLFAALVVWTLFVRVYVDLPLLAITSLLAGGLCFLLAGPDRRWLIIEGFRPPPRWLAIVPLLYVLVRSSRRFDSTHRGFAPFWLHVAFLLVAVGLTVWGPFGVMLLDRQNVHLF